MVEILAPAGDKEAFLAAIHNGANAIYLGLQTFNARGAAASNFSLQDLEALVPYAHVFGVKVYLALNTLIKEEELNEVIKIVHEANKIGVDAFIVQDIGLASFIRKIFPVIELHASTQMGIHNVNGAIIAQKLGIKRVVLSRETSLDEIVKIKKQTNLDIEFFVQGALCVAFSGACNLSHEMTGKSANRGGCAQPCRHHYEAQKDGKTIAEGFLLSAKDISLISQLKSLVDAGVTSFKIEGRARRPAYVAEATRVMSEIVSNNFLVQPEHETDLKKVFNRGDYCEAYLNGKENIIYPDVAGHIGVAVGKVLNFMPGKKFNIIRVSSSVPLSKGDGLKFLRQNKDVGSVGVYDVQETRPGEYSFTTTSVASVGDEVRLISQAQKEQQALERRKKLVAIGVFEAKENQKPTLSIEYQKYRIKVEGEEVAQTAINHAIKAEEVEEQLIKTGNEVFSFLSVKVNVEHVFLRKQQINELRRKGFLALTQAIANDYKMQNQKDLGMFKLYVSELNKYRKSIETRFVLVNLSSENQISEELVHRVHGIAFHPPVFTSEIVKRFVAKVKAIRTDLPVYLFLPPFANADDIALIDKIVSDNKGIGVVANNLYGLAYVLAGCPIIAGPHLNIFNSRAVDVLDGYGVVGSVISPELAESEAVRQNHYSSSHCMHFAFGNEALMHFVHCPVQVIKACTCDNCQYFGNYDMVHENGTKLSMQRTRLVSCTFHLCKLRKLPKALFGLDTNLFLDFTNLDKNLVDEVVKKVLLNETKITNQ